MHIRKLKDALIPKMIWLIKMTKNFLSSEERKLLKEIAFNPKELAKPKLKDALNRSSFVVSHETIRAYKKCLD